MIEMWTLYYESSPPTFIRCEYNDGRYEIWVEQEGAEKAFFSHIPNEPPKDGLMNVGDMEKIIKRTTSFLKRMKIKIRS